MAYDARTGPQEPQPRRTRPNDSKVNVLQLGNSSMSLGQSLDRRVLKSNVDGQRAVARVLRRAARRPA
jgi:hypothetical protein